jgi:hypothetical protein
MVRPGVNFITPISTTAPLLCGKTIGPKAFRSGTNLKSFYKITCTLQVNLCITLLKSTNFVPNNFNFLSMLCDFAKVNLLFGPPLWSSGQSF